MLKPFITITLSRQDMIIVSEALRTHASMQRGKGFEGSAAISEHIKSNIDEAIRAERKTK